MPENTEQLPDPDDLSPADIKAALGYVRIGCLHKGQRVKIVDGGCWDSYTGVVIESDNNSARIAINALYPGHVVNLGNHDPLWLWFTQERLQLI